MGDFPPKVAVTKSGLGGAAGFLWMRTGEVFGFPVLTLAGFSSASSSSPLPRALLLTQHQFIRQDCEKQLVTFGCLSRGRHQGSGRTPRSRQSYNHHLKV
jgi:hypothetical protein